TSTLMLIRKRPALPGHAALRTCPRPDCCLSAAHRRAARPSPAYPAAQDAVRQPQRIERRWAQVEDETLQLAVHLSQHRADLAQGTFHRLAFAAAQPL